MDIWLTGGVTLLASEQLAVAPMLAVVTVCCEFISK